MGRLGTSEDDVKNPSLSMVVDPATVERLTGYPVGGISPFGMKQRLRVMIDAGLLSFDKVAINGGRRGLMLVMSSADILKVTEAEPIEL